MYEKLKELNELKKQGILSEEEFNEEKKKILNEGKTESKNSHVDFDKTKVTFTNKKLAYILFAILLGNLGVHKFACGKIGAGVIYLAFFWTGIPGVIGVVEGILAVFKETGEWKEMNL